MRSKVESLTDAKAEESDDEELFEAYVSSQKSRPDLAELQEEIKRRRAEREDQLYRLRVLVELVEEARRKRAEAEREQREEAQERAAGAEERAEAERKKREGLQREVEELKRQLEAMKRSARLRSQEEEPEMVEGRSFRR